MGDVKKWSATYTKHIKQKRKVYQDGLLELHIASHKIMLYDDCEKLLDSRFVKKDDVVRSGETLAFNAYLVDIGDPEGDHKPISDFNFQGREKKITDKAGPLHAQKSTNNSTSGEDRKTNSRKNKAPLSNLSPSQKIIREFKKNKTNKYGAPQARLDTTKASINEWQVLYTTQITQKSKKYHDGILKVAACGSRGRQVMLYDGSRRPLDSRFLKKDEVIGSGESLTFDGHLVDIGEPEGDHKPLVDSNFPGRTCSAVGKIGLLHGQRVQHNSSIGKPRKDDCSGKELDSDCSSSDVDNIKLSKRVPVNKPLREAYEILSSLRKPMTQGNNVPTKGASIERCHTSQSSDLIHLDLENQLQRQFVQDSNYKRSKIDDVNEETTMRHRYSGEVLKSKAVHDDLSLEIIKSSYAENNESQPRNFTSTSFFLGSGESNILGPKFDSESSERSTRSPVSSIEEPQDSDALKLNIPDDSQPTTTSVYHYGSHGNLEAGEPLELVCPKATSSCRGSQFSKEVKSGNSLQPNAGSIMIGSRWCEEAFAFSIASSSGCTSHGTDDVERKSFEEHKKTSKMDECPSFDLGF
ncbi:hypothetical protein F0562_011656 [Nyssa sinensis]|uniref:5'-3' DNA helicase ZGRF1-like N-terminal domain-containing protein n=1 Tax=Nyssa sinensis TaxID=561372 RepID=A0A5J4ZQ21_9ASTE|nr:hypothetical protein F0562_011656 [Nyssa sinensis]